MKRNRYILFLLVIALFQAGCDSDKNERDKGESLKDGICNCNDVFLDPAYGHFFTESRELPFSGYCEGYYPDGTVKVKKYFEEGKLEGHYTEYHENGKIKSEWNFLKGRQHGDIKGYDTSGVLNYHAIFYKGDHDTTLFP